MTRENQEASCNIVTQRGDGKTWKPWLETDCFIVARSSAAVPPLPRPGNGYPMRLLLPGWEGNMNIKWLRRIKLVEMPAMSYYEARTYAPILPGGKAYQFYFLQKVKSFITHPSAGLTLSGPGLYEISGIAYSATGRISKVMVSADAGKSWAEAALQDPAHAKAFTPVPRALALGRRTGHPAKPRVGRVRQRAADARTDHRRSRRGQRGRHRDGLCQPALQRPHEVGNRARRRSETCVRISCSAPSSRPY